MSSSSLNKSVSFFIPFRNEEAHLALTVSHIKRVAEHCLTQYEIIIVNDGSTDSSAEIAVQLAVNENIHYIDLKENRGFGFAYLEGFKACKYPYAMYLTADGDVNQDELSQILIQWNGTSPLVQSAQNLSDRQKFRFLLSKTYTFLVQLMSQTKFPYYNGFNLVPTENKTSVVLKDFGFCTQASLLLQLLKNRNDIQFVSTKSYFHDETSQALTMKNMKSAIKFFIYLLVSE